VVREEQDLSAAHSTPAIKPAQGVQLEAGGSHVVADAGALDAGGEVVADLALVVHKPSTMTAIALSGKSPKSTQD
jgi:hypothetical protein